MSDTDLRGLTTSIHTALLERVGSLAEETPQQDYVELVAHVRALKALAARLCELDSQGGPSSERAAILRAMNDLQEGM